MTFLSSGDEVTGAMVEWQVDLYLAHVLVLYLLVKVQHLLFLRLQFFHISLHPVMVTGSL